MTKHVNPFLQVAEFNRLIGNLPQGPKSDKSGLYAKLFAEEVKETCDALALLDAAQDDAQLLEAVTDLADGLVDVTYIAAGWLHIMGLDARSLFAEVHRSNMAKIHPDGTAHLREDGKVLKPEGWTPPNLKPLVARQLGLIKRVGKDIDAQIDRKIKAQAALDAELGQGSTVERMFSVEQAALICGVGEDLIRQAIEAGQIRHKVFGVKTVRIPESALAEFQK